MRLFSFIFLLWAICGYSQMEIDSTDAIILFEIKKDTSGKYVKRTFKDLSSGIIYEFEANPEKFSFELREDVIQYLRKAQKKFNEKNLYGAWTLKSVTDFSGKNLTDLDDYEINETLEFNLLTTMFIKKPISETISYTGCYSLDKKYGTITTLTTRDLSQVLLPQREGNKLPEQCIKQESNIMAETFYLYTLDSDHLTLYMFIPSNDNEEFDQTVLLNYVKVHY